MDNNILTVSGLNLYVKTLLSSDRNLRSVYLRGEISNLTDHYRSGHIYLTLKDDRSAIKAVMFAGNAKYLKFKPKDGMMVIVRGSVSLYDVTGTYQFYIEDMQPDGVGALSLAFEQLKEKLRSEGLFDEAHKKPLPPFPKRIGVITSPTGAAVQDILRILKRRYPVGEIIMCPVAVQGENAVPQLIEAVRRFDRLGCADVIIIGRGGGSIEDLWAFNDEGLARAIFDCGTPVVSAVGHETDFTICDFVSDVRASTPSAGAELVSPEIDSIISTVSYCRRRIGDEMISRLKYEKERLERLSKAKVLKSPMEIVEHRRQRLDMLSSGLKNSYSAVLSGKQQSFAYLNSKLDALSPLKVLSRGYSITMKNNKPVLSVKNVEENDQLQIRLSDGDILCKAEKIKPLSPEQKLSNKNSVGG